MLFTSRTGRRVLLREPRATRVEAAAVLACVTSVALEREWIIIAPNELPDLDGEIAFLAGTKAMGSLAVVAELLPDDQPDGQLDGRSGEDTAGQAGAEERSPVIVGMANVSALGRLAVRHSFGLGLSLRKDVREEGVGTKVLTAIVDWCRRHPWCAKIDLSVFTRNARAIGLYRKLGFQERGVEQAGALLKGEWVDILHMTLFVKSGAELDAVVELANAEVAKADEAAASKAVASKSEEAKQEAR